MDDLADFVRTIYQIDSLDEKIRLDIAQCLKFHVEILNEPVNHLGVAEQHSAIMMLLKDIKAQNELLINKVSSLEEEVLSLKKQNQDLRAILTDGNKIPERNKSAKFSLFGN